MDYYTDPPDLKTPRDFLTWVLQFLWLFGAFFLTEWILYAFIPDYRMYDPNSAQGIWAHVVWLVLYFLPFCLLAITKAIVRARKREAVMSLYGIEN